MEKKINDILKITESYKAPDRLMEILFDEEEKEKVFGDFLELFNYNVDFDWFHEYFQEEHADRKKKKQDFTPRSVANVLARLVGNDSGNYYEVAAGTGGLMITYWDKFRRKHYPWNYKPEYHFATVEELSTRTVPFLLLNMAIRGMNGVVINGDCLTRECKDVYFVINEKNDHLKFSKIYKAPHTEEVEKEYRVKFSDIERG